MMKRRSVPHGNAFLYFIQLFSLIPSIASYDSTLSQARVLLPMRITEKETIVSPGDGFELGFFKPETRFQERDRWYLGIWYKRFAKRVVWVANRDNPLSSPIGSLQVANSNIVLLDRSGGVAWTTNLTSNLSEDQPLYAELFHNGNFVLRYPSNNYPYPWQSFDFPTDTLLPGMKLGWDRRTNITRTLRSWKSLDDPASGSYVYKIEISKLSQGLLFNDDMQELEYRSGPSYRKLVNITETDDEITHSLGISTANFSSISLLRMEYSGTLQLWEWTGEWNIVQAFPTDLCDPYDVCGKNSYYNIVNNREIGCDCIPGFHQGNRWSLKNWKYRCVRKSQMSCDLKLKQEFMQLRKMKLPETTETIIVDTTMGIEECRERCLTNCNCTAFANTDMRNGSQGCVTWTGDLFDLRNYSREGQDLYVKLAAVADLGEKRKVNKKTIIGLTVGGCLLLVLSFIILCFWMRRKNQSIYLSLTIFDITINDALIMVLSELKQVSQETNQDRIINTAEDWGSKLMEFDAIAAATNNFSDDNKLGKGGFGIVYKGHLSHGQEIAVKRLTKMTPKGVESFNTEMKLIAMLQHTNLIRLVGFCSNKDEKIVVYEYLQNSSLDTYLFDTTRGSVLNWEQRFDITVGIVRGLVYLHQDSRFRIIHLDLKPGNILLDKDMTPKISDFGTAWMLGGGDETEAHVTSLSGTYGYVAPEFRNDGTISVTSDVFSFGVMLLEMISGKKNLDFFNLNDGNTLLNHIWYHWNEGNGLEIVDPTIKDSSSSSVFRSQQVLRCIQIGLLCVQYLPEDRPTMSTVGLMLARETEAIPQPKSPVEIGSSSRGGLQESISGTVPETTMTIEGR
ncbi:PREDICTED: receptor-like serine/threonine-protein kinase SD1-8 [Camelina sativa]|uniref:Receptor-like serine/threonine-protein kinase n=1 Tax=Camelina sativa TaxID=90675 RepID=A0ABM0U5P4_CAMSA|nr:PREDICTED: receptor-like serine/threonine-protein kinase SD1-8 [Camelina sativa]